MTSIENKLKEYRRRKEEETQLLSEKSIWEKIFLPKVARFFKFESLWGNNTVVKSVDELVTDIQDSPRERPIAAAEDLSTNKYFLIGKARSRKKSLTTKENVSQTKIGEPLRNQEKQTSNYIPSTSDHKELKWMLLLLKISLWIILYFLFLELECGAIYVLFSAFYLMFTNFRNGQRKPWEPSAYSVFNPGCESIEGALKPEQFEKEIRYGF